MKKASGKLVIIAILIAAVAAAGTAWWYRYNATHRAVEFWGPGAAQAIRDAPIVELFRFEPSTMTESLQLSEMDEIGQFLDHPTNRRDISSVRGLTHLRAALFEDRSYLWPARSRKPSDQWRWILVFRHESTGPYAILLFSGDWQFVTTYGMRSKRTGIGPFMKIGVGQGLTVSCKPIAAGLESMLGELATETIAPATR